MADDGAWDDPHQRWCWQHQVLTSELHLLEYGDHRKTGRWLVSPAGTSFSWRQQTNEERLGQEAPTLTLVNAEELRHSNT